MQQVPVNAVLIWCPLPEGSHLPKQDPKAPDVTGQVELVWLEMFRGNPWPWDLDPLGVVDEFTGAVKIAGKTKVSHFGHQGGAVSTEANIAE